METRIYNPSEAIPRHEHTSEICVFCDIIRGQAEASVVTRNDEKGVIAFMDLQGYPLVCPIKHVSGSSSDLEQNADVLISMNELAFQMVRSVREVFQTQGVNVVTNIGEAAGQEIPHIHTHIIPRYENDKLVRFRRFQPADRSELDSRAEQLSTAFNASHLK